MKDGGASVVYDENGKCRIVGREGSLSCLQFCRVQSYFARNGPTVH